MQRQIRVAVAAALLASACGSSPAAPTPPAPVPAAVLSATGQLSFSQCVSASGGDGIACQFAGMAQNVGPGCASGVSGQTFIYRPNSNVALDTKAWTYSGIVRPAATFTYSADGLMVPSAAGGTYATTFAFTSVSCP